MRGSGPFRLGPFTVDAAGRLSPGGADCPTFRLRWRDRTVQVRMTPAEDTPDRPPALAPPALISPTLGTLALGTLAVQTVLGRVPSTAQPAGREGAALRRRAFAALLELPGTLPPRWRARLLPDHRVALEAALTLDLPASAAALVTALSVFLLDLAPYLDALEEAGMAKTCPG